MYSCQLRHCAFTLYFCLLIILSLISLIFFFNDPATTEIYTLSLHDALPISTATRSRSRAMASSTHLARASPSPGTRRRSEEHTSELQSLRHLVCRLLLEKKKKQRSTNIKSTTKSHIIIPYITMY